MIITVFVTTDSQRDQWCSELLEYSWQQAGQTGELVRLVAMAADKPKPVHGLARVVKTRPWEKHPYIADHFAGYNKPAALLEWLMAEQIDATILLLDTGSIVLERISEEPGPNQAVGNTWKDMPSGKGPFGLSEDYANLQAFCVNRQLKLAEVSYPLLIHSTELKKLAARWLELTGIIRCEVTTASGKTIDADRVAYSIAAAEYRVPHKASKMAVVSGDRKDNAPILNYLEPIESPKGKIIWDIEAYKPWELCKPEQAATTAGRAFLAFLLEYSSLRKSGGHLHFRRPQRCLGVREAHIMGSMLLEIPGETEPLTLNSSAASIWKLCDGQRTLGDIVEDLKFQFEAPREVLCNDVELAINLLHSNRAIDLEIVT